MKIHIPNPLYTRPKNGRPFVPLCNAFTAAETADKISEVTCKRCLKRLESLKKKLRGEK